MLQFLTPHQPQPSDPPLAFKLPPSASAAAEYLIKDISKKRIIMQYCSQNIGPDLKTKPTELRVAWIGTAFSLPPPFSLGLQEILRLKIDFSTCTASLTAQLLKNSVPLRCKSRPTLLMGIRFLNNLNSQIRMGKILLEPKTGILRLEIGWTFDLDDFSNVKTLDELKQVLRPWFSKLLDAQRYSIEFNIHKILTILGQLPEGTQKLERDIQKFTGNPIRKFQKSERYASAIEMLTSVLQVADTETSYMTSPAKLLKYMLATDAKKVLNPEHGELTVANYPWTNFQSSKKLSVIQRIDILNKKSEQTSFEYKRLFRDSCAEYISRLDSTLNVVSGNVSLSTKTYDQSVSRPRIESASDLLRFSQASPQVPIHSDIVIFDEDRLRWTECGSSGYSHVHRAHMKFYNVLDRQFKPRTSAPNPKEPKDRSELLQKVLAKKTEFAKPPQSSRNAHQKALVKGLEWFKCGHIAKFYDAPQGSFKDDLMMDYYSSGCYSLHAAKNRHSISHFSKIVILRRISAGLVFLKDVSILHRDIKPENVLIGRGLMAMLTDFGESVSLRNALKVDGVPIWSESKVEPQYSIGFTMPYVAPETLWMKYGGGKKTGNIKRVGPNSRLDNYSLGVMMFSMIFGRDLIGYRAQSQQEIYSDYFFKTYRRRILVSYERGRRDMASVLGSEADVLGLLCLRLLHEDESQRPCMEWVLVVLMLLISCLTQQTDV